MTEKKTVVVTGFGPFGSHSINASTVAVQELSKVGLGDEIELVTLEMPVVYEDVKATIPSLWRQYHPSLMVHVGVSGIAQELTLEQQAHNEGYSIVDIKGCVPGNGCCIEGAPHKMVTSINMNVVCEVVNKSNCGVNAVVSKDPGRYLCDFSFYCSLNIDSRRSAFIHVPRLDNPYSAKELAVAMGIAIKAMLKQMS